jgi:hypothetical protein
MARNNRLPELRWLYTEHGCLPADLSEHAARSGSIDVLKWLKKQGVEFDEDTMCSAAHHAHVVRYLRSEGCPWGEDASACLRALERGDRDLVVWALEHGFDAGCDDFCDGSWFAAIGTGSLAMVMWFDQLLDQLQRGPQPCTLELESAMRSGHVDICRYLKDTKNCGWDSDTVESAALSDKQEVCERLLEVNNPLSMDLLAELAAYNGKLTVLRWALQRGAQLRDVLLEAAAEGGHLAAMQYLDSQGCDWVVPHIYTSAALGGSVDVLVYVFAELERDEWEVPLDMMLNAAGRNGKLAAAKWLRERGAQWPAVLHFVREFSGGRKKVYEWKHDTLKWARAEGCTSPTA